MRRPSIYILIELPIKDSRRAYEKAKPVILAIATPALGIRTPAYPLTSKKSRSGITQAFLCLSQDFSFKKMTKSQKRSR